MMTLQGMADHGFTSVSLSTNVFLGEIIFFPLIYNAHLNIKHLNTCYGLLKSSGKDWQLAAIPKTIVSSIHRVLL